MDTHVKSDAQAPAGFYEVEAAGLRWLAEPGAVSVARVIAVAPGRLEIEHVPSARPSRAAAITFGRQLAALHDAGAPAFGAGPAGWTGDGFIGTAPLPLRPEASWGRFYARWRLEPYRGAAGLCQRGHEVLTRLCDALEAGRFDDDAPAARIHGDLWSGNALWTPRGVTLIDPAAHGGHRITDLAMLALFGVPFFEEIEDAYERTSSSLPRDWRRLIPLHQVHPLLVHAALFGGSYSAAAAAAAEAALGAGT